AVGIRGKRKTPPVGRYFAKILGGAVVLALAFIIVSGLASHFIHKSAINGAQSGVKGNIAIFSSHAVAVADDSAQTRYSTWPKAVDYVKEQPIKGAGAYNSRVRLNLASYEKGVQDIMLQPFNNDFIGLVVDLGLIGMLAFAPVVIALIKSIILAYRRVWQSPSTPFGLAAIAMLVQSNFFQSILLARLWVVVGIALAGLYLKAPKN
ncbi:O-antigen ligase family protein, partial [Candidatus Saccharibacteria bacterium]|nr:O-antigen ligase family protein [Candidatus Saccharibacteria bacterium]